MLRVNVILVSAVLIVCVGLLGGCETDSPKSIAAFPITPLLNPNTASDAELGAVPELNAELVQSLIDARPFDTPRSLDEFLNGHLNEAQRGVVYQQVFVTVGLNSGDEEDFKLIPSSMSPRKLAHEFEEYRPYTSIEQFQREMSKYVGDNEVQHLSRYVSLD